MKQSFSTAMCVMLCVVLTALAICIGAVRGWSGERNRTMKVFSQDGEIYALLDERAMDAANLAVVAARHLSRDNPSLLALQDARRVLISGSASLQEKAAADTRLSAVANELGQTLPNLASVQASARDQAYISTLTRTLSEGTTIATDYAERAGSFNQRITNSVTGHLAMLLGVDMLAQ